MRVAMNYLKKGDKIRLNKRTIGGWKGIGTVIENQIYSSDLVWFIKEEPDEDDFFDKKCCALRQEVSKIRKSSVNHP